MFPYKIDLPISRPSIIHARKTFANEILLNLEACEIDVVLRTFCSPTNRIFNWMATSISRLDVERMVANPRTAYAVPTDRFAI